LIVQFTTSGELERLLNRYIVRFFYYCTQVFVGIRFYRFYFLFFRLIIIFSWIMNRLGLILQIILYIQAPIITPIHLKVQRRTTQATIVTLVLVPIRVTVVITRLIFLSGSRIILLLISSSIKGYLYHFLKRQHLIYVASRSRPLVVLVLLI
jgi:hypothetical protein